MHDQEFVRGLRVIRVVEPHCLRSVCRRARLFACDAYSTKNIYVYALQKNRSRGVDSKREDRALELCERLAGHAMMQSHRGRLNF